MSRTPKTAPSKLEDESDGIEPVEEPVSIEDAIEKVGLGRTQWILLVICGLSFVSDAAEVTFLSFVTEQLKCEWDLTVGEETVISMAVFFGMFMGSPLWGCVADKTGRRAAFLWSSAMICTFGFITALAWDFWSLCIIRGLVGFGVAGLPIGFDILAEALPTAVRGGFLLYIEYFWTFGSIYVTVIAYLTLAPIGWQVFTCLAAVPTLLSTIGGFFLLPESPRWLVDVQRESEALVIINQWAKANGSKLRFRSLLCEEAQDASFCPVDLIKKPKLRKTSILMFIAWFAFGCTYYGVVMLLPRIFQRQHNEQLWNPNATGVPSCNGTAVCDLANFGAPDHPTGVGQLIDRVTPNITIGMSSLFDLDEERRLQESDYEVYQERRLGEHHKCTIDFDFKDIFTSAVAEIVGVVMALLLIDRAGRVMTQVIFFVLGGAAAVVLGFPEFVSISTLTLAASMGRMSEMAASSALWVHTPELFPTRVRAQAHGVLNLASRIGAICGIYVISDAFSQWQSGCIIGLVSLTAAAAVMNLEETAGKEMGGGESDGEPATTSSEEETDESE